MGLDTKTYWLTDRQSQCEFDFDFNLISNIENTSCVLQLQWYLDCVIRRDCYNYCVKIRYQETTSEDRRLYVCCSYSDIWSV
jgi:hypothetical protein